MMLWFVERTVRPMELDASNAGRLALLRELGLGSVATEKPVTRHVENSPTGKPGTVVAFSRDGLSGEEQIALVKYDPSAQEWHRCAGGKYWCGKLKGETIASESLRRDDAVPGYMVRLGDGQDWEVARARYHGGRPCWVGVWRREEGASTDYTDEHRLNSRTQKGTA